MAKSKREVKSTAFSISFSQNFNVPAPLRGVNTGFGFFTWRGDAGESEADLAISPTAGWSYRGGGSRSEFEWDTSRLLTKAIAPDGSEWGYTYDERGNLTVEDRLIPDTFG